MDAELRADGLGSSRGILIVEGPDDKRVFARHVHDHAQILPAGGRRLLISAHQKASAEQRKKMVFVTDCDYEVRRGNLTGAPDLIITTRTDMEGDLFSLGLLEKMVIDLVPRALESQVTSLRIAASLREEAERIALPLGRLRMAAQPLGIALNLEDLRIVKYWNPGTRHMDADKLVRAMHSKVASAIDLAEWCKLVEQTPTDSDMCHGKDLTRAICFLLKANHRVEVPVDSIVRMMRSSLTQESMDAWDVIRRIKAWQAINQRFVLGA
ncbi:MULTISPECIES: hypothetical protein [Streptomyces albidoflavus group]|uniref:DUF4435 domain-containing protein n=1 Tax=Streptomyces albidoflavus TaxID=1886 RepID=A0ABY3GRM2_9ACTN|nr:MULTISPECIES: hypothetical protein [Streptomyces albidoflavus group]TWV18750.1 hypothetical protein FRZ02_29275 [Streptomyces albidoflavus]